MCVDECSGQRSKISVRKAGEAASDFREEETEAGDVQGLKARQLYLESRFLLQKKALKCKNEGELNR